MSEQRVFSSEIPADVIRIVPVMRSVSPVIRTVFGCPKLAR